ncbi:MAG TPA: hypothetical protein VFE30_03645 [Anaeromyxobacteraceae bacterium]|nr:hypothetical protein [Anaeromyxobacteraceae bacterium]
MRLRLLAIATLLSWSAAASAAETDTTSPCPPFTFALHGFVSGSVYGQDANFGPSEGQQSLYLNPQTPGLHAPNQDRLVLGGDVRQSRFNFSVAGPKVFGGATPKAVLEVDFFGGFGSGNFGDVSLTQRLRWAYAELNWGDHRVLFGQTNDLIFTIAPVSLAHIAFPYGYGSGNIGWRRPGVFGFDNFKLGGGTNLEFAWEVGRSQWADAGGIGNSTVTPTTGAAAGGDQYGFNMGEGSAMPAVEGRLTLSQGPTWQVFTTGHWNRVDRKGVDQPTVFTKYKDLDVVALNAGAKLNVGPLSLAATGYTGKNLAPLVGNFLQFQANDIGDIHEMGGWVQAGLNLTKELSVWGYAGVAKPKAEDAYAAKLGKIQNVTTAGMLQYRDGGYAIGLEWIHMYTQTRVYQSASTTAPVTAAQAAQLSTGLSGNQVLLSGNYFF